MNAGTLSWSSVLRYRYALYKLDSRPVFRLRSHLISDQNLKNRNDQPSLLSKGLGYDHKYAWAAYNPKSGKFFTADAGSTPSMAQCRRPDCRECGLRLNVKSPIYRVSSALEKDYMKRLAKWYEQEAGEVVNCGGDTSVGYATVSVQSAAPPPGKLKKIGDCEVVMVSNSKYKAVYADVHVEVRSLFFFLILPRLAFLSALSSYPAACVVPRIRIGPRLDAKPSGLSGRLCY